MDKIKDLFAKKVVGLPIWGWGLILIGGVGIGYYFLKRNNGNSASTIGSGTTSDGQVTSSSEAGTNVAASPSLDNPNALFSQTVGNSQVPILPYGYSPIYNPTTGELEGYQQPGTSTSTTSSGNSSTGTTSNVYKVVGHAVLESSPELDNHGKKLADLHSNDIVTLLSGPVKSKSGKMYYRVSYNGMNGYIGSGNINLTGQGDGGSPRARQAGSILK